MGPHRSDRNRDGVGRATGPRKRVADPVGMFELYRRHPYPMCADLRRGAARPDRSTPRKSASPTRDCRALKKPARPPGLYEYRSATPTGTTTRCRANGPTPLRLSPCGIQPLLGRPWIYGLTILLLPVLLRLALLRTTPPRPSLVTKPSLSSDRPVPSKRRRFTGFNDAGGLFQHAARSLSDITFVTRRRRCDRMRGRRPGKTGGVFTGIH